MRFSSSVIYAAVAAVAAEAAEESSSCAAPPPRDACEASGAAEKLNDLFNAKTDSYQTSGFFNHGFDCGLGNLITDAGGCDWRFSIAGSKLPQWSLGWKGVEPGPDAVCPPFETYATEQPPWDYPRICPTPKGISLGSLSFSYLRADLGTPKEVIQHMRKTVPEDQAYKRARLIWGPIGMILTGAPLKETADCPQLEPGAEFWDEGRIRGLFTRDGASWFRDACGVGYEVFRIMAGLPNRNDGLPGINLTAQRAPEDALSSLKDTKEFWCPPSGMSTLGDGNPYCSDKIDTPEAYYEYYRNATDTLFHRFNSSGGAVCPDSVNDGGVACYRIVRDGMSMCALDEGRFELFTQVQQYDNWPQFWKDTLNATNPAFALNGLGVWNEAVIRSFEGVRIRDIAPYLALYYFDKGEGDVHEKGFYMDDYRKEIYSIANAIYANTGISVPVVALDEEGFYLEKGVVQRPVRCGVPPKEQAPSDFRVDPPPAKQTGDSTTSDVPTPAKDPASSDAPTPAKDPASGASVVQHIIFAPWSLAATFAMFIAMYIH